MRFSRGTIFKEANAMDQKMFGLTLTILIAVLHWQKVLAQLDFKCPSNSGYYADPEQCDMYYECRKGEAEVKLCKDGLVFNDKNPLYGRCDFPFAVDCGNRIYLQEAKSSTNCPRKNGIFPDENSKDCKKFWQCVGGLASKMSCQTGLAFNPKAGTCQWKYLVPGCE